MRVCGAIFWFVRAREREREREKRERETIRLSDGRDVYVCLLAAL